MSCDCNGGKLGDKNRSWKIENVGSIFSAAIFVTQPPTNSPPPLSQSSQDPQIRDIESLSNIFGNLLITIAIASEMQYREFKSPAIVMELRGGVGEWKSRPKKIENVGRVLKKMFKV